jgi:co-chaperonin GroES (HSP10)
MFSLEPLDDRVLVRRIQRQRLITLTDAEPERYCEVIACGPGKKLKHGVIRPMAVRPGSVVYLPGIAALEPDHCYGQDILVREDDIGFIVEEV